jgi:hypothetical protein
MGSPFHISETAAPQLSSFFVQSAIGPYQRPSGLATLRVAAIILSRDCGFQRWTVLRKTLRCFPLK